jgi:DNA-binding GntR family transcriptional regulator
VDRDWRHRWVAEIEEMIGTIRAGKPSAAREAVRNHIASACDTAKRVGHLPKPARIPKSRLLSATSALAGGALE